jgi:hypothetical protein
MKPAAAMAAATRPVSRGAAFLVAEVVAPELPPEVVPVDPEPEPAEVVAAAVVVAAVLVAGPLPLPPAPAEVQMDGPWEENWVRAGH